MKIQWKLNLKKFGRIEETSIDICPLMIFIGDNNSGKSYLMTLLWGLISKNSDDFVHEKYKDLAGYERCKKRIQKEILRKTGTGKVTAEDQKIFVELFNQVLEQEKDSLLEGLFHSSVTAEALSVEITSENDFFLDQRKLKQWRAEFQSRKDLKEETPEDPIQKEEEDPLFFLYVSMDICVQMLFGDLCLSSQPKDAPLFLPASRTGFMLTYKALINESLRTGYGRDASQSGTRFTLPIIEFLNRLVNLSEEKTRRFDTAVHMVEEELIHGTIVKDNSPVKRFYFDSEDMKEQLPLYLASSLVTEVSPLLLFLTDAHNQFRTLILEEPEAHLHLKAQIVMAKVLAIIANQGIHVWLTTHSDTFFQQINNLVKFKNHPKKELLMAKYNIREEECLGVHTMGVYQFDTLGAVTCITKVEGSEFGFPAGTFNQVLDGLMDEVMELEEES